MDRYTKVVLTVIASALVYLCLALTPLPALSAQFTQRPGEGMGPVQVVVVGWRAPAGEVVQVAGSVQVNGQVVTAPVERASRVVIAGYEMGSNREASGEFRPLGPSSGLPTSVR
jgi:hypothetical protein